MSTLKRYTAYCQKYDVPVFYQPWYLDAVCGSGSWDVAIYQPKDGVIGLWPYFKKRKYGLSYITLPMLVPYLGPWYQIDLNVSNHKQIQIEKDLLSNLADQLPWVLHYLVKMPPYFTNWQPLIWKGYTQQTRYTYIISEENLEEVSVNLSSRQRNAINQAKEQLTVSISHDAETMFALIEQSFSNHNEEVPYSKTYFLNLDNALANHDARKIYLAYENGKIAAGIYVVEDKNCVYNLATGRIKDANRGAVSLLIWHAITDAIDAGKKFDFEGSMIERIEKYFRSFGGEQVPYFKLMKFENRWVAALMQWLGRV